MRRKYIIIIAVFLGLIILSCSRSQQRPRTENPSAAATVIEVKDSVVVKKNENTSAQQYSKPEIPVLCYHRISDGPKSEYRVSAATFASHMKALSDSGYHSISPAQLYDYLVYNRTLPEKPVMISFDDSREEHFSIAAPIMEKYGFRGVFFIMTITYNKKNYMTTDQIALLSKAGHTIGLHSWDHTMVIKYKESADWQKQVVEPKKKLEGIVGKAVEYWAYPNGVYNHDGAEELGKYFKLSFTLYSKRDSDVPLQTVRRMIVPECTSNGLLKSMHQTFRQSKN
jgi:peptidoglycan/xylan/chitin deacetylase (PgdA/CDA1 family)